MEDNKYQVQIIGDAEAFYKDISALIKQDVTAIVKEVLNKPEDPEELVKVSDISTEYGVSSKTLLKRVKERHIPSSRLSHNVAIERKYIKELVKAA